MPDISAVINQRIFFAPASWRSQTAADEYRAEGRSIETEDARFAVNQN
jgi:hypothetical protein